MGRYFCATDFATQFTFFFFTRNMMSQSCVSLLTKSQNKIYVVCFMWCLWNMKYQFSFFFFMNTLLSLFQYIKKYLNYLWLSWMVLMTNKCKWFATRALFEFYLTFMNCFQFSCDFSIQNCFDIFSQIISLSYGLTTRVTFEIFVTFVYCFNL